MPRKIFVNLPVQDLQKSIEFFKALGFTFNPQFTDETAACMVITEDIYTMLLTHEKFSQFTPKAIADAHKTAEVLVCLSCENREEVDATLQKAEAAGGTLFRPANDYGFMYERAFQDLDGHIWEVVWMDPATVNPQN